MSYPEHLLVFMAFPGRSGTRLIWNASDHKSVQSGMHPIKKASDLECVHLERNQSRTGPIWNASDPEPPQTWGANERHGK